MHAHVQQTFFKASTLVGWESNTEYVHPHIKQLHVAFTARIANWNMQKLASIFQSKFSKQKREKKVDCSLILHHSFNSSKNYMSYSARKA